MVLRRLCRAAAILAVVLSAAGAVAAESTGSVQPAGPAAATGELVRFTVVVDLGTTGSALGSYGASLTWDPASLDYVSDTGGGDPSFASATLNRGEVEAGVLRFGDASAAGAGGQVAVMEVVLLVTASPPATTHVDLEFTSMYAAGSYQDLYPDLEVHDAVLTVTGPFRLWASEPFGSLYAWDAISGAVRYDLIRGDLAQLTVSGPTAALGPVVCVENDSVDTTTAAGTEPASPDTTLPSLGAGFFYVARFEDGAGPRTYGFSAPGGRQRVPGSGDCP